MSEHRAALVVQLRILAVLLAVTVLATACGAGSGPSSSVAASAPGTTASPSPTELPLAMPRPTDQPTDGTCESGVSCLGLLGPGTHSTRVFTPRLTFTLPSGGWENISDEVGIFQLLSTTAPGDVIAFFRNPRPVNPDKNPALGVAATAEAYAAWLASNDQLAVTPAREVTIGGLKGLVLDIRVAPTATARDPSCPTRTCVPILEGADSSAKPPWSWDWGSAGLETQRLYLVAAPVGLIAIFVDSLDGTTFDTMTAAADAIMPTVRFG